MEIAKIAATILHSNSFQRLVLSPSLADILLAMVLIILLMQPLDNQILP